MYHVRIDLFTAARLIGLLPCADNLYDSLPKGIARLNSSVIRVFTEANHQKTPTAIFRMMKGQALERWPGVGIEPITVDRGSIIGMIVDGASGEKHRITWGSSEPNLERGMVIAEVNLDRPKNKIAAVKPFCLADRYAFAGHGTPDLDKAKISALQEATREARRLAQVEVAAPAMKPEAAPADQTPARPAKPSPQQRRALISRLLSVAASADPPGDRLHPLAWSDSEEAEACSLPVEFVTMERIGLGLQMMSHDEAANQVAAEVRRAIAATSHEATDTLEGLESATEALCQAARRMLELFKL